MSPNPEKSVGQPTYPADWLEIVHQQVQSLRFGVVQIVVHDSQVTQIEKTERVRMDKLSAKNLLSRPDNRRQNPSPTPV